MWEALRLLLIADSCIGNGRGGVFASVAEPAFCKVMPDPALAPAPPKKGKNKTETNFKLVKSLFLTWFSFSCHI